MRSEERFDIRKRDSGSLVDDYQIAMPDFISIVREYKLYELSVIFVYIDSHDSSIVIFVGAVNSLKVHPVFEIKQFQADDDKLEQSLEVVR